MFVGLLEGSGVDIGSILESFLSSRGIMLGHRGFGRESKPVLETVFVKVFNGFAISESQKRFGMTFEQNLFGEVHFLNRHHFHRIFPLRRRLAYLFGLICFRIVASRNLFGVGACGRRPGNPPTPGSGVRGGASEGGGVRFQG